MRIQARHYFTGEAVEVLVEGGQYVQVRNLDTEGTDLPWIAPGLLDVQINGFGGVDFNRAPTSPAAWDQACEALYASGCTGFLLTFISHEAEEARALAEAWEGLRRARPLNCLGYHLEGPFLNPAPGTRGAHRPEVMIPADTAWFEGPWKSIEEEIRLITLAPETSVDGSRAFIEFCDGRDIRVSIGHSEAMGSVLDQAIAAGADAWTHLGNAVGSPMPKFENVIFQALAREGLRCFVIPDGQHVPPHVVKVFEAALQERMLLTTDAMAGAGAGRGTYTLGSVTVEIGEDGVARLPESGRLAGSTLRPFDGVFRAAEMTTGDWPLAWASFSSNVGTWLGLEHEVEPRRWADFCLLSPEEKPQLLATVQRGEVKFGKLTGGARVVSKGKFEKHPPQKNQGQRHGHQHRRQR